VPANTGLFLNRGRSISVSNFPVVTTVIIHKTPVKDCTSCRKIKCPQKIKHRVAVGIEASKLHNRRNSYLHMLTQGQKEIAEGRGLYKLHLKAQFLPHTKHTAASLQGPVS
jgi:hypothetical protein